MKNEIVIYQPQKGEFRMEVRLEKDTVWLTQAQIANSDKPIKLYSLDVIISVGYRVENF